MVGGGGPHHHVVPPAGSGDAGTPWDRKFQNGFQRESHKRWVKLVRKLEGDDKADKKMGTIINNLVVLFCGEPPADGRRRCRT